MKISYGFTKITFIWITTIFTLMNWTYANESIVVDEEFYSGGHPPIVRERESGYFELYIAPTNIKGVFHIIDLKR